MDGQLRVRSLPGVGATFELLLSQAGQVPAEPPPVGLAPAQAALPTRGRVL